MKEKYLTIYFVTPVFGSNGVIDFIYLPQILEIGVEVDEYGNLLLNAEHYRTH